MGLRGWVSGYGHTARRSGDEPGEARRDDGEDILDREHRGQGDPNAIGRFGDLGDELGAEGPSVRKSTLRNRISPG